MSHDSCAPALASDWLVFFSSMARMKQMLRMGDGKKALQIKTMVEVHAAPKEAPLEPPVLVEPPVLDVEAPSTQVEKRGGGQRQRSWGR